MLSRVGCAYVSSDRQSATISLAGGPTREVAVSDLSQHGDLFVTQLGAAAISKDPCLAVGSLRGSDFLPTSLAHVAEEIGTSLSDPCIETLPALSEIYARTLALSQIVGADPLVQADSLFDVLRSTVAPPLPGEDAGSLEVHEAMAAASIMPVAVIGRAQPNDRLIRVPMDRWALFQDVMSRGIPGGEWRREIPVTEDVARWIVENDVPALVCATVPPRRTDVCIGSGPVRTSILKTHGRGTRLWFAAPEFLFLEKLLDLHVEHMWVAEGYVPSIGTLRQSLPSLGPQYVASLSAGLFSEAMLYAICQQHPGAWRHETTRTAARHNPRSVWSLSAARAHVLGASAAIANAGFAIVEQGLAHITVAAAARRVDELADVIADTPSALFPTRLRCP